MNDTKTDGPMTCEEMRARIEDLERRVLTLARDEAIDARLDAEREALQRDMAEPEDGRSVALARAIVAAAAEWPAEDPMKAAREWPPEEEEGLMWDFEEPGEVTPVRPALPAGFGAVR